MQHTPPAGHQHRPALVTPGRVIMLLVALIALYVVWPSLLATFSSFKELRRVSPAWFLVMLAAELASFACIWLLISLCLGTSRYFAVATAQVTSNAISKIVPGGSPVGAAFQFGMLADAGIDRARVGAGTAAATLINVATLFALPVLSIPAILGGVAVSRGLARAAWLGVGLFLLLVGGGAALLLFDRPVGWVARAIERVQNVVHRRGPPIVGLEERLTAERDAVRSTLGARWGQAILRSAGNVLFDYMALLAALVASGARPRAALVLLAYVAAVVLGSVPITPGGLGFVEAGLAGMLVLAGVPAAEATLATLAYRLVSYWLPIVAGPVAYTLFRRTSAGPHTSGTVGGDGAPPGATEAG